MKVRVHYEDVDMGGIVYYANYLAYIERARSEWVAALGIDQLALRGEGTVFAVRRIEADYAAPARFGDLLDVTCEPVSATPARATVRQEVLRDGTVLFAATVTLVAMGLDGRPRRLPAELRRAADLARP